MRERGGGARTIFFEMKVVPITIKAANAFVLAHHRHNKPTQGGRFAIGAIDGDRMVGVAIVGRTLARMLHDDLTAEVTRLAVCDGAPDNACSFLYGACRRIWATMGGQRLVTYTLTTESGASLRGAGWKKAGETATGQQWGRKDRPREDQAIVGQQKFRWEAVI